MERIFIFSLFPTVTFRGWLFARSNGCDLLYSLFKFVELVASFMLGRMILWSITTVLRCPMISTINLEVKCFCKIVVTITNPILRRLHLRGVGQPKCNYNVLERHFATRGGCKMGEANGGGGGDCPKSKSKQSDGMDERCRSWWFVDNKSSGYPKLKTHPIRFDPSIS